MKNIFFVVKKKWIAVFLVVLLIVPIIIGLFSIKTSSMPKAEFSIVIDAGHGGLDVK